MTRLLAIVIGLFVAGAFPQQPQFRSGVDVVELSVAVLNGKKVVTDLTKDDFEVTDNAVRQEVLSVSREVLPIDVTLVIDTSQSLTPALQNAIVNAANVIRQRLKPADRLSLIAFNQRIQEQLALRAPADVGTIRLGRVTGQTSLNDALGVVLSARPVSDRRQMAIVLTDGYDSTSLLTQPDVLALAGRSNTAMFFIARGTWASGGGGTTITAGTVQPIEFFQRVSAATGGMTQIVPAMTALSTEGGSVFRSNPNLLDGPFLQALEDFRSSYTVSYGLSGVPRKGWHAVTVRVTKGRSYQVRTRTGYVGG